MPSLWNRWVVMSTDNSEQFDGGLMGLAKVKPSAALSFLRQRENITTERYGELQAEAHARAFTSAGITETRMLNQVSEALLRSQAEGTGFDVFQQRFAKIAAEHEWTPRNPFGVKDSVNERAIIETAQGSDLQTRRAVGGGLGQGDDLVVNRVNRLVDVPPAGSRVERQLPCPLAARDNGTPTHERTLTGEIRRVDLLVFRQSQHRDRRRWRVDRTDRHDRPVRADCTDRSAIDRRSGRDWSPEFRAMRLGGITRQNAIFHERH